MQKLKVLTLNTWGVFTPYFCEYKNQRIAAIAKQLSSGEHDIILLEEIWTQADYEKICHKIQREYPFHHYFHSGMIGSGTCIFSKYSIQETFYQRFSVNGYAHKIHHGDWFGGKGVGLAKILCGKININVYVTHMHAQYKVDDKDEYAAHRLTQAFEMSEFIRLTSSSCDVMLAGGDFNIEPYHLAYKILASNAALDDAWTTQLAKPEDEWGTTCDRPDNRFGSKAWQQTYPHGQRLDHIMYAPRPGFEINCNKCTLAMRKVPGEVFPYSDHEGVEAEFSIMEKESAIGNKRDSGELEKLLTSALPVLDKGMKKVKADQVFYIVALLISIFGLIYSAFATALPYGLGTAVVVARFFITVACGYFFWMAVVLANTELNGLLSARKNINNILKSNPS